MTILIVVIALAAVAAGTYRLTTRPCLSRLHRHRHWRRFGRRRLYRYDGR